MKNTELEQQIAFQRKQIQELQALAMAHEHHLQAICTIFAKKEVCTSKEFFDAVNKAKMKNNVHRFNDPDCPD